MRPLHRSEFFNADFDLQYRWYLAEAGESIAERYFQAVLKTLRFLARQPEIGRRREFKHPELQNIRSFRVEPPFTVHLIFYRVENGEVVVERILHGSRDLPRRLTQQPGVA